MIQFNTHSSISDIDIVNQQQRLDDLIAMREESSASHASRLKVDATVATMGAFTSLFNPVVGTVITIGAVADSARTFAEGVKETGDLDREVRKVSRELDKMKTAKEAESSSLFSSLLSYVGA